MERSSLLGLFSSLPSTSFPVEERTTTIHSLRKRKGKWFDSNKGMVSMSVIGRLRMLPYKNQSGVHGSSLCAVFLL
jgi:hypothetical protein